MTDGLLFPDLTIEERIQVILHEEIDACRIQADCDLRNLDAFRAALIEPVETRVKFNRDVWQKCWCVTREGGAYRVVYAPLLGCFSLCVEGDAGMLDIGVRGSALGCYASV
jgi:hypothetical protein